VAKKNILPVGVTPDETTGISGYYAAGSVVLGAEKNAKLHGLEGFRIYSEMRRTDPQLAGLYALIRSAICGGAAAIIGGAQEQADWVRPIILDGLHDHMTMLCQYLLYGSYWFEQVIGVDPSGRFTEIALLPRQPWTIAQYETSQQTGELVAIRQTSYHGSGYIPAGRLVAYTNEPEGDNFEGISLFRPCYGAWMLKQQHMRLEGISAERYAVASPIMNMSSGATKLQKEQALELGTAIRSGGSAVVVKSVDDGIGVISFLQPPGGVYDATPKMAYYDQLMSKALLSQFIDFGSHDKSGSFALVSEHVELFYDYVNQLASDIAATISRQRIKRLIDYNWADVSDYPILSISGINRPDGEQLSAALALLAPLGVLDLDSEDRTAVREAIGLRRRVKTSTSAPAAPSGQAAPAQLAAEHHGAHKLAHKVVRELTAVEQHCDFVAMAAAMDSGRDDLARDLLDLQRRLTTTAVKFLAPRIAEGDIDGINGLRFNPTQTAQIREQVTATLSKLFAAGRDAVKSEAAAQGITAKLAASKQNKTKRAATMEAALQDYGSDEIDKLVAATETAAKQGARQAVLAGIVGAAAADLVASYITRSAGSIPDSLAASVSAMGFVNGRDAEAQELFDKNMVKSVYYSAVMDQNTCTPCADRDGAEVLGGQPAAPNPDCLGVGRCRCVHVYEFGEVG